VAAEAALVTPLVLLIVFGIVEMALLMHDNVALGSLAERGAHAAVAHADTSVAEGTRGFAQYAADAVAEAESSIPKGTIEELWVYRPNEGGYPCAAPVGSDCTPQDESRSWTCAADCLRFEWNASARHFDLVSGSWAGCPTAGDQVGVYLSADHAFLAAPLLRPASVQNNAVLSFDVLGDTPCDRGDDL